MTWRQHSKQVISSSTCAYDRVFIRLQELAAKLKAEGNDLFRQEKFSDAAERYSQAIENDPSEAALYSNRAACYASLEKWEESLQDANTCLELRPDWPKGYFRRALALSKTGHVLEGRSMCDVGLRLDPESKELSDLRTTIQEKVSFNRLVLLNSYYKSACAECS